MDTRTITEVVEAWLDERGMGCDNCKHGKKSRFDEHCRGCINNIGIILNFESNKKKQPRQS